jgi:hypothetical protein
MVRIQLTSAADASYPSGLVLNAAGEVIGDAQSYTYGGCAFAVHSRDFAGWVPMSQVEFVEAN